MITVPLWVSPKCVTMSTIYDLFWRLLTKSIYQCHKLNYLTPSAINVYDPSIPYHCLGHTFTCDAFLLEITDEKKLSPKEEFGLWAVSNNKTKLKLSSEFDPYTQFNKYTKNIGNQRHRQVFEKMTLCLC